MSKHCTTIHLEGMDLSGKTTAATRLLAEAGGHWQLRRNSLVANNPVYRLANQLRKEGALDSTALAHLYVAALRADIHQYQPVTDNTVQDSTILLRSLAFHSATGTPGIVEALMQVVPQHPRFDVSIVLTADLGKRLERLQTRAELQPDQLASEDLLVRDDPRLFQRMEGHLINFAQQIFSATVIDTTSMTPDQVVGGILDITRLSNGTHLHAS